MSWVEELTGWLEGEYETLDFDGQPIPGRLAEVLAAYRDSFRLSDTKRFFLERHDDVSGVSGTGIVAEGVQFSDGKVVLRWIVGDHRSTVHWDSIESVEKIHGHDGRTLIEWVD